LLNNNENTTVTFPKKNLASKHALSFQNHPPRRWNGLMCHRHGVTVSTRLSSTPACRPIVAPTKQRDAGACPDRHKDGTIVSGASKQTQASQFTQEIPDKNQSNLGVASSWVQLQMQG
jgi:hypothetical protein